MSYLKKYISHIDNLVKQLKKDKTNPHFTKIVKNGREYEVAIQNGYKNLKTMPNFYVYENVGAGKTFNSRKLEELGMFVKWSYFWRQFNEQTFMFEKSKTILTQLLIIDDIGSSALTLIQLEILLEIIDMRMDKKLKTIITTNLSLNDLQNKMKKIDLTQNQRIADRLKTFTHVNFDNESLRV
ncbi:hypothetical protein EMELA_v1c03650 [Mesoplasma melaleucae]|uniref:IstB-like ATP-binding domain-containing protein n=1 Tax=Mesoplasma melaleucae TaxID=81459 RepID=A0A2K8NVY2_9MOLU|nr:ATP-binding protein [Mesoplasma melaleucae]ATZ17927.1 hypothetical protein EMELA_v1c03650 [Mesoplasma melaleucae]